MAQRHQPIWTPYFARKFSASRFEIVMRVFTSDFYQREFGAHLRNNLVAPSDGRNYTIYHQAEEWQAFEQKVYERFLLDEKSFARYRRMIKRTQRRSLAVAESIAAQPLPTLSWAKLGRLWQQWDRAHLAHFLRGIWIIFVCEPLLAADAISALEAAAARRGLTDRLIEFRDVVFSPSAPNALAEERAALLKIAVRFGSERGPARFRALEQHAAEFGFIPCYDAIDAPWTVDHFEAELTEILSHGDAVIQVEREKLVTKFLNRRQAFRQLLRDLKPTNREAELLRMAHEVAFLKDERDDYRRRQMAAIRPLYAELARRADLPERAPLYLIHDEMVAWFRTGHLPIPRSVLLERLDRYLLIQTDDGPVQAYGGSAVDTVMATLQFADTREAATELRGLVGNGGQVQGPVRIVHTVHDLKKVQAGDVMVAVTTNPDYLSAMRRCVAFVTDEGGITSHAAIVARELHVPCIVGTKHATKTFRDGDLVEVNATGGIVKHRANEEVA